MKSVSVILTRVFIDQYLYHLLFCTENILLTRRRRWLVLFFFLVKHLKEFKNCNRNSIVFC